MGLEDFLKSGMGFGEELLTSVFAALVGLLVVLWHEMDRREILFMSFLSLL